MRNSSTRMSSVFSAAIVILVGHAAPANALVSKAGASKSCPPGQVVAITAQGQGDIRLIPMVYSVRLGSTG